MNGHRETGTGSGRIKPAADFLRPGDRIGEWLAAIVDEILAEKLAGYAEAKKKRQEKERRDAADHRALDRLIAAGKSADELLPGGRETGVENCGDDRDPRHWRIRVAVRANTAEGWAEACAEVAKVAGDMAREVPEVLGGGEAKR